ncbi:MAG: TlyA family RNA methyltransferase [Promethearchaeia archaeon]
MKERLDILLVERRLVESRTKAQWLIKNNKVLVNKKVINKPGKLIGTECLIELIEEFPYVGKGGIKLEAALNEFKIKVKGKICADFGSSIGGFVDCLLKHGAKKVYAIDTAKDLLHPSLLCEKNKGKVIPLLGVDVRNPIKIKEAIDICTIDVTFASLSEILPNAKKILQKTGDIVALVKPLYEITFSKSKNFDVKEDYDTFYELLNNLRIWCLNNDFYPYGLIESPIKGKGGSTEFFYHLRIDKIFKSFDFEKIFQEFILKR